MSNKQSRHTPSPTLPPQHASSKLPKFLQKQNRDRSKSVNETLGSPSASSLASSTNSTPDYPSTPLSKARRGSKFLGRRDKEKEKEKETPRSLDVGHGSTTTDMDEPPVIVEPVSIPRPRTQTDRPTSSAPDSQLHYSTNSNNTRIGDLPTRLSGWFSHTFSTSTTDLSLPTILAQSSPKNKASSFLSAAKHGKGHLDKAMRYLLDSDATPDKCTDPIWLLGVQHPGYEPPSPVSPQSSLSPSANDIRRGSGSPPSFRSSTSSVASNADLNLSISKSSSSKSDPAAIWPSVFYIDFVSRIWLTYRSHFPYPLKDTTLADVCNGPGEYVATPSTAKSRWHWGGEKSWSSDTGWGCMLRTGQSLLANALIHTHLGREWRRPPYSVFTADYATYTQVLTWFLDTPSPEAPFSVHRMALAGKELGTDVGQWFGPSVAAGALKRLVNAFPGAGIGVSVAKDGVLARADVFAASHTDLGHLSPKKGGWSSWGDRPVLVLIGLRLGIDGVNPIYYDTIKALFTFPQSVGIAGGRPSSSYYFVGSQTDNLFYLDPHQARPAIPMRTPPSATPAPPIIRPTPDFDDQSERDDQRRRTRKTRASSASYNSHSHHSSPPLSSPYQHQYSHTHPQQQHSNTISHARIPTSPSSVRTGSSTFSHHAPTSPSPLQREFSTDSSGTSEMGVREGGNNNNNNNSSGSGLSNTYTAAPIPIAVVLSQSSSSSTSTNASSNSTGVSASGSMSTGDKGGGGGIGGLDTLQEHYVTAYTPQELKTFHCEKVRKMHLSGLDPSMLLGFLCKDEKDWEDFKKRVEGLPRSVFAIQDEHPNWSREGLGLDGDEDGDGDGLLGMESMSESTDDFDVDLDEEYNEEEEEEDGEILAGINDVEGGNDYARRRSQTNSEVDTEEDPVEALTPGPQSRFDFSKNGKGKGNGGGRDDDEEEGESANENGGGSDIEDDWIDSGDPALLTPMQASTVNARDMDMRVSVSSQSPPPPPPPSHSHSHSRSPPPPLPPKSISPSPSPSPQPIEAVRSSKSKSQSQSRSSQSKSHSKAKSEGDEKERERERKSRKKEKERERDGKKKSKKEVPVPIPVPIVRSPSETQKESYPFPGSGGDGDEDWDGEEDYSGPGTRSWDKGKGRRRYESQSWAGPPSNSGNNTSGGGNGSNSGTGATGAGGGFTGRMFAGKGRDGGRTQSGGVKGILTDS